MVTPDQVNEVLNAIGELPKPEPQIQRIRLWAHPVWAGTMLFLLAAFWIGRKLVGFV